MIEVASLAALAFILSIALKSEKMLLSEKINELHKKVDPSIGEELKIESVKQVVDLIKTIRYEPEVIDRVSNPRELLNRGYGDCEDFAVLTYSLLEHLGLNPKFAIAYNEEDPEAHAFVFYKCQYNCNTYYIFSNRDFFKASSVEEAAKMLGYSNVIYEKPETIKLAVNQEA